MGISNFFIRIYSGKLVVVVVALHMLGLVGATSLRDVLHLTPESNSYEGQDPLFSNEQETYLADKRADTCPPHKPFKCPEGNCIPLKYLCDYNSDCPQTHYDENKKMCTAAQRPTVESTEEFLKHELDTKGNDVFVKLFGPKAANRTAGLGGVQAVAVAMTESPRLIDFATAMRLTQEETEHLRRVLKKMVENDKASLAAMGFTEAEIESLQPVVEQLNDTGFLKD